MFLVGSDDPLNFLALRSQRIWIRYRRAAVHVRACVFIEGINIVYVAKKGIAEPRRTDARSHVAEKGICWVLSGPCPYWGL